MEQDCLLHTTVWKQEWSCVRKGGLSLWANTLFSTIVHSTSSSWITTSFFRILMAYSSSVDFISASITCRHREGRGQPEGYGDEEGFRDRQAFQFLTLPKLPFPSRARKLKSLNRTRSMLPEGRLNRRWSDGVMTFLPWPSLAFCGIKIKSYTKQITFFLAHNLIVLEIKSNRQGVTK